MQRWSGSAAIAGIVLAVTMAFTASAARSECTTTTQGEFAIALAQVLGLVGEGSTPQPAIEALVTIDVKPASGWEPDACFDAAVQAEIESAILAAIDAGTIGGSYAGVVQETLDLLIGSAGGGSGRGGGGGPSGSGTPAASRTYNPPVTPPVSPFQP